MYMSICVFGEMFFNQIVFFRVHYVLQVTLFTKCLLYIFSLTLYLVFSFFPVSYRAEILNLHENQIFQPINLFHELCFSEVIFYNKLDICIMIRKQKSKRFFGIS